MRKTEIMGTDKFSSTLDSLTGYKVNLYIGEEVVKGKLVGVEEDHVILENENNYIYYYNLDHIQAITKNTKQFQAQEFTGEIIATPSMQQVLSSLMLQWVTILCMNKQKFAGILSEINSDFATLINGEERIVIKLSHISHILKGYIKEEENNSKNENNSKEENNQSENSNKNKSQSQSNEKNNQAAASNSKEKEENKKGKDEKSHKDEKSNKDDKNHKEDSSSKSKKNDKKKEKQFNGSKMTQKKEEKGKVVKLKLAKPAPPAPPGPPHPPHHGPKHEPVEQMGTEQGEKEKEKKEEKNDAKKVESQSTVRTNRYVGDRFSIRDNNGTASYTGWPMINTKKFVN